jgi:hypothetical protein
MSGTIRGSALHAASHSRHSDARQVRHCFDSTMRATMIHRAGRLGALPNRLRCQVA